MWISGDISVATARTIAAEIKKKKRLAFHVMSLRMSRVSKKVLEDSDLEEALALHADHPGIGLSVQQLLRRFFAISMGREDRINRLFETTKKIPFRQPIIRARRNRRAIDGNEKDENSLYDGSDTDGDYSDTDSEFESLKHPLGSTSPIWESSPLLVSPVKSVVPNEEKRQSKRKSNDKFIMSSKLPRIEESPEEGMGEAQLAAEVAKILKEIHDDPRLKAAEVQEQTKKHSKAEKKEKNKEQHAKKKAETKTKEKKPSKTEVRPHKPIKEKKKRTPMPDCFPIVQKVSFKGFRIPTKKVFDQIPKLEAAKIVPVEEKPKILKMEGIEKSPTQILADKLNALPLSPKRKDISPLLSGLTSSLLIQAENLIGRKMKRVNSVWWELFYRDFGKVHSKDFSGNIRDLYEVKKKATEDTEKSLLKIAQLPPPPPPPF